LAEADLPFALLPFGRGNDFARNAGMPTRIGRAWPEGRALDVRRIDLPSVNGALFGSVACLGFDAAVNLASYEIGHSRRGLWLYVRALVRMLGRFDPVPVRITMNGMTVEQDIFLLTIGNGTTCGGGFKLTPHARVDDGLLDVTIVAPLSVPALLWHLPKVFLGTIDRATAYARLTRTAKLTVESQRPLPVHVDGEIFAADGNTLAIEVVPRALTVIGNFSR